MEYNFICSDGVDEWDDHGDSAPRLWESGLVCCEWLFEFGGESLVAVAVNFLRHCFSNNVVR